MEKRQVDGLSSTMEQKVILSKREITIRTGNVMAIGKLELAIKLILQEPTITVFHMEDSTTTTKVDR